MTTVRQLERFWGGKQFDKLIAMLLISRVERSAVASACRDAEPAVVAAALTLNRLHEIDGGHVPLASRLIRFLASRRAGDGGWGDPPTTALVLRALLAQAHASAVVDGGIAYLSQCQRDDGGWAAEPLTRMPSCPAATALTVYLLAAEARASLAIDFAAANRFLTEADTGFDPPTRQLASLARRKTRVCAAA